MTIAEYPHVLDIQTRWNDNDLYGHVNNVVYYAYFDTVINRFLVEAGLDWSGARPSASASSRSAPTRRQPPFPTRSRPGCGWRSWATAACATSSASSARDRLCAQGSFVHVFVDRTTRKPVPIPDLLRTALSRIARGDRA